MVPIEERRAYKRFEMIEGHMARVNDSFSVSIKNISTSGISLTLPLNIEKHSVATIDIMSGEDRLFSLTASVIWSTFWGYSSVNANISCYETGFRFTGCDEQTEGALRNFLNSLKE